MTEKTSDRHTNSTEQSVDLDPFTIAAERYFRDTHCDREYYVSIRTDTPREYVHKENISLYFQSYDAFDEPVKKILRYAQGKIIDIGCGPGRFALHLQGQGFDVTGLDRSPGLLEICVQRGLRKVFKSDVMQLRFDDPAGLKDFDTALLLGRNIGIGGNIDGVVRLLKNIYFMTTSDARIIFDSLDMEKAALTSTVIREDVAFYESVGRPNNQLAFQLSYEGYQGNWFDWIHLSPSQLGNLSHSAGWEMIDVINGDNGYWTGCLRKPHSLIDEHSQITRSS